ncbi:hypothetical protein E2562_012623 [Oryza meyeriana var. granulata]|uniref:Uncharacterized protein n=1 Tax=Oryza meyeriana var. granulata TaxID=110450 RepID=A0A6G1CFH7_9ORYZ|nr:hypothetical protein E2562_012623 [Oryza meyeriana var. granulata]
MEQGGGEGSGRHGGGMRCGGEGTRWHGGGLHHPSPSPHKHPPIPLEAMEQGGGEGSGRCGGGMRCSGPGGWIGGPHGLPVTGDGGFRALGCSIRGRGRVGVMATAGWTC